MVDTAFSQQDSLANARVHPDRTWVDDFTTRDERFPSSRNSAGADAMDAAFEMVRRFIEGSGVAIASRAAESDRTSCLVDWEAIRKAIAGSRSIEQAIGRAVVIADQMRRGIPDYPNTGERPLGTMQEDSQFFGFSVADAIPDFGDHTYRTRVVRRLTGIFGSAERS
jgi:hypothetical protein